MKNVFSIIDVVFALEASTTPMRKHLKSDYTQILEIYEFYQHLFKKESKH